MWTLNNSNLFLNADKIHPLKRLQVKSLLDQLTAQEGVDRVIVFGSSVEDRCTVLSDVDICVVSNDKVKRPYAEFPFDLIIYKDADNRLLREINNKGVIVYEK